MAGDFLPGRIVIERGTISDYRRLAHFHYVPGDPAVVAGVWRAIYRGNGEETLVAVGVLAYPTPACRLRERVLGLSGPRYGEKLKFLNANVRTIARVIVHPQFRALAIASRLVRRMCQQCPARYVEAIAAMGKVHPFFEKGGMRRIDGDDGEAAYFLFEREERECRTRNAEWRTKQCVCLRSDFCILTSDFVPGEACDEV